jgi:hypothetical protein
MDKTPQSSRYTEPVSQLLTIGFPDDFDLVFQLSSHPVDNWPDYPKQYGLTASNIPELIRLATDEDLLNDTSDDNKTWAPMHAWRALGQLHAADAVQPLLDLLHRADDEEDDLVIEELPDALALIGPPAFAPTVDYLLNQDNKEWARSLALTVVEKIAALHPQVRGEYTAAVMAALENYAQNPDALNGDLAATVADHKIVEAYPLVEKAYADDRVDELMMGDWEDFQVAVGLLKERITPQQRSFPIPITSPGSFGEGFGKGGRREDKKTKQKRKQAKASRKKNRKRK